MSEENKNEDLDNLLDDALKDFEKLPQKDKSVAATVKKDDSAGKEESPEDPDAFFIEQANKLGERMSGMFSGQNDLLLPQNPDQILDTFKKMAEAAALTLQGENPAPDEEVAKYSDSITQALKGLQEGTDNLTAPVSENYVANMFSGLNLDGSGGDGDMFLPFMESMMQSLLSAAILLPTVRELLEKYPKYLEEHGDKIKPEEKERFEKQFELFKTIEGHLEQERTDDEPSIKREKYRIVLEDMRKLEEYGQPPEEIWSGLPSSAGFPPAAIDAGAGGPQCPTM